VTGPLSGLRILELAGIGPAPFAAMALSDAGADVLRVDRPFNHEAATVDDRVIVGRAANLINRGRRSVTVDLKDPRAVDFMLDLIERADGLIEGFRPGVMERLGLGPEVCHDRNSRLIYGRVTGWGREGPYASMAGHDINYIALSGTLSAIGRPDELPVPPLNLLGDFGGGGLMLAYGMTCALFESSKSGQGQVVDVSMVDGSAYLASYIHGMRALRLWNDERGSNVLDGGAPYYQIYETRDAKYMALGAIEDQFFIEFLERIGLAELKDVRVSDRANWKIVHERLVAVFAQRTREEWEAVFDGTDSCVTPVLTMDEAIAHEQLRASGTFIEIEGVTQPAPTPRFSRTPGSVQRPAPTPGQEGVSALREWGLESGHIQQLLDKGTVVASDGS
jgi:alpha-methylacyl-CoA racemase